MKSLDLCQKVQRRRQGNGPLGKFWPLPEVTKAIPGRRIGATRVSAREVSGGVASSDGPDVQEVPRRPDEPVALLWKAEAARHGRARRRDFRAGETVRSASVVRVPPRRLWSYGASA
jgi:hypothetical protein